MLKKVVEITSSASVLALTANALQKELDEKRAVLAESEKEILCLIRERYSNLIDEAIKTHNQSMKPLIKEKEEIAFSVSRAMAGKLLKNSLTYFSFHHSLIFAVYKDVQHAFSQDVLSFFSEIKNVQTRLYQSNEDVDALLKRYNIVIRKRSSRC